MEKDKEKSEIKICCANCECLETEELYGVNSFYCKIHEVFIKEPDIKSCQEFIKRLKEI